MAAIVRSYVSDLESKICNVDLVESTAVEVIAHNEAKLLDTVRNEAKKADGLFIVITLGRGETLANPGAKKSASGPLFDPQRFLVEVWSNPANRCSTDPLDLAERIIETIHNASTPGTTATSSTTESDPHNVYDVIGWDILPPDATTNFFRYQININARVPLGGTN